MFAAIRHYKLKAGSADVVVQRAQEGFVPLISSLPGFVATTGSLRKTVRLPSASLPIKLAKKNRSAKQRAG